MTRRAVEGQLDILGELKEKACAEATCSKRPSVRGWCRRHYKRWLKTGSVHLDQKPCESCDVVFVPEHGLQIYCSPRCKRHALNESQRVRAQERAVARPMPDDRRCTGCGEVKPPADFGTQQRTRCKQCQTNAARDWRTANPEKVQNARIRRHGITPDEYEQMLSAQGNCCAICRTEAPTDRRKWNIDHDHSCCPGPYGCRKCIRGVLCGNCNRAIGLLGDNSLLIRRAARYLEAGRHQFLGGGKLRDAQ